RSKNTLKDNVFFFDIFILITSTKRENKIAKYS
ncbi:MAG: hypothetical protein ACI902_003278, partial [Psychroserpens sp.]